MKTYQPEEMLAIWKTACAMSPMPADDSAERIDSSESDLLMMFHIDGWYDRLLRTAPAELLPVEEIAPKVEPVMLRHGVVTLQLPENCVRVVSVMHQGWLRPACIVTDMRSTLARLQESHYTQNGPYRPVALVHDGTLELHSTDCEKPALLSLRCVMRPDNGVYRLHESLLSTIPKMEIPL